MLLNYSVVEDSWESLGLQGDQISQSQRTSVLNIHWKEWCWSWSSNILATWCEELTHWKRFWCWERLKAGEGDDRGWDGWMASPTRWTWVWVSSESSWWTRKPGVLQSMGSQRVGHDWVTETWGSKPSKSLYLLFCRDLQIWSFSPRYKAIPLSILAMLWLFELLLLEVRVAQQKVSPN